MNANRRKRLKDLAEQVCVMRDRVDELRDEEQDAIDNLPESLQDTERAQDMNGAVDSLDQASGALDEIEQYLNEATGE